jgi:hypothetical protein
MSFPEPTGSISSPCGFNYLQKAPAKPKKAKEVEKPKPEEEAEAPAENGEAKDEVRPRGHIEVALTLGVHQTTTMEL